jgi:hypothetical protein
VLSFPVAHLVFPSCAPGQTDMKKISDSDL